MSRSSTARTRSRASWQEVAATFYHGETKRSIHGRIAPYYETINARASQISEPSREAEVFEGVVREFLSGL